jgi:hypothetical protein
MKNRLFAIGFRLLGALAILTAAVGSQSLGQICPTFASPTMDAYVTAFPNYTGTPPHVFPNPESYFAVSVPADQPIAAGLYSAWCVDANNLISPVYQTIPGTLYTGNLLPTCDPIALGTLPNHGGTPPVGPPPVTSLETWHKIDYLLNHKAGYYFWDVQVAINRLVGGPSPNDPLTPPDPHFPPSTAAAVDALVADANANAAGWAPSCGDTIGVIFNIEFNWDALVDDVQLIILQVPLACIGDRVWLDTNSNGLQDSGEAGVPGVTVQLYTCDDVLVGTTTTDANGLYHFLVLPGDYYVKVTPPAGYTFTISDVGADDAVDSDVDIFGKMSCTTLVGGEVDNTWDAGLVVGVDQCVTLTKTADSATARNGAQMGYTYTIHNCGNTVFSNLAIVDDAGTPDYPGDDFTVASGISLNPGETKSFRAVVNLPVPTCAGTGSPAPSAGTLITQILPGGDVKVTFRQSRNLNDNVYGAPAPADGWSGHTFGNLTGSDKAEFRFTDGSGKVVLDFYLDYVTATTVSPAFPSGYASLGPNGGDGSMITGAKSNVLSYTSTLADSLNHTPPFPSLYTVNSPTPEASFPTWDYVDGYTVVVSKYAFGSAGFGGVTIPYVHNSPAKTGNNQVSPIPCGACIRNVAQLVTVSGTTITGVLATDDAIVCTGDPIPPTPPCLLTQGALKIDKNTIQVPIKNNGATDIFLTEVDLAFPAINGKLKKVTLNGDVWVGLTGSPASLTSGFTSDPNKRKIAKGQTKTLVLQFEKNASKVVGDYSGGTVKFGSDSSCSDTFLP